LIFPVVLCLLQAKSNAAIAFYNEPPYYREEHIQTKIDGMVKEAKAKMSKGDKKGTFLDVPLPFAGSKEFDFLLCKSDSFGLLVYTTNFC
jgi:hypothetical protein